jgi:SAM-dependent methyltransferase
MFFPDPVRAVREMLRVLKPGGHIALAAWHFAANNPFHYTVSQVVGRYVKSPPLAEDAPDAFRFAQPGKLRAVLAEAGATAVSENVLQFSIQAPISVEDFWTLRSEMSENIRTKLANIPNEQVAELKREAIEALRAYSGERGMSMPAEVLIVGGRKSA